MQINFQIGDFGLSRDLDEENYYISNGGKIPVKWTAPEACVMEKSLTLHLATFMYVCCSRLSTTRSTLQPVTCGVLGVSCMKYGVSDTSLLKRTLMARFVSINKLYSI